MGYQKNGNPEPGWCKRTDGKKWRCSGEVALHQKYCEHHLRRGRSRSRKLVEAKNVSAENHKKTHLEDNPLLSFNAKDLSISATPSRNENDRDLVTANRTEQQGKYLVESRSMGLENEGSWNYGYTAAPDSNRDYVDLFSRSTFPYVPELGYQNEPINVWSIDNFNNNKNVMKAGSSMSPNDGDLSPSLTLSMAIVRCNVLDEEMGNIQMGSEIYGDNGKDCWEPFSEVYGDKWIHVQGL